MSGLRLGTRASALARIQTQEAARAIAAVGAESVEVTLSTQGDQDQQTSLRVLGGQGIFVRALETALIDGRIDVAVHSAKDVPTDLQAGTTIAAFLPRADVRDVLVCREVASLAALAAGARVGSSSRRRSAQLLALRNDLVVDDIRGNVETRLRKLHDGEYDAIILAAAGLLRLGRGEVISEYLPIDSMLPSPGQGAIALQARSDDSDTLATLATINHDPTARAVRAERAVLRTLGAGCTLPVAALAHLRGPELSLAAKVLNLEGSRIVRAQRSGDAADPEAVGTAAAEDLLAGGAAALLGELVS